MNPELKKGKVLKIQNKTVFHISDLQTSNIIIGQLQSIPTQPGFYHLLKSLTENTISYQIIKKENRKHQEHLKLEIFLQGKPIHELYKKQDRIQQCTNEKVYEKDEIFEGYVMEVECLKLKLFLINQNKSLIFYFSQLKLVKVEHAHPKQVWQKTQQYFRQQFLGIFVQVKVNGSQNYRQQMNIYGEILQLDNGLNLKQKAVIDGFAELSKNSQKYLNPHQISKLNALVENSKNNKKGIWKDEIKITKGTNQIMEQKYKQWEDWIKNKKKYNEIKNVQQEIKQICSQLKKNCSSKPDPNKCRILIEVMMTFFEDFVNEHNIWQLQDFIRIAVLATVSLQTSIIHNTQNIDFLKYLNKLIIIFLLYVLQNEKLGNKNKLIGPELDKIMKTIFRCCFIGNQTFHEKVFDKKKQPDFNTFEYDQTYLSGISSYSQYSENEEVEHFSKQSKLKKKISSAQTKIRINATLLISNIFKNFSSIVQNHWEICVKSNVLTQDFVQYLQKLKISAEQTKMSVEEKKDIASLMRTNFGDCSLVLLVFFQQSAKVKMNALNCMINMVGNLQSRKIVDKTETIYIQKLLKSSKFSYVSKFYIIISGLRNALYFMLFSLHHERNLLIIINTFKALTELCQQSALIDKMGFREGMGLLMSNYIVPVLRFQWDVKELLELKCLCIEFLGALVDTQKRWEEMENEYLMSFGERNINLCLIKVLKNESKEREEGIVKQGAESSNKIIIEITKYFRNLTKRYYHTIFHHIQPHTSIWIQAASFYLKFPHQIFTSFIKEVFKCHYDQLTQQKLQTQTITQNIQVISQAENYFKAFLPDFIKVYSQLLTSQNYVSLINALTYIDYDSWSSSSYEKIKQFLIHCFDSIKGKSLNQNLPSIESLKQDSLVRLYLIKLLGYISFCKEFQTPQFSTDAIRSLLSYSRTYKSSNTVSKIAWGISNWLNVSCFRQGLTEKQLKQCIDYMIRLSKTQTQKIASNCTRGMGFFLSQVQQTDQNLNLAQCKKAIIRNLSHSIIKVRTNSTKTLRAIVSNKNVWTEKDQEQLDELTNVFEKNIFENNFNLQTETLLLIKDLGNPICEDQMMKIYGYILENLSIMDYQFEKYKVEKKLRKVVLKQMVKHPKIIASKKQICTQFCLAIKNFLLDEKKQSLSKAPEQKKIFERGFEQGEQARTAVFNKTSMNHDEEKQIVTQLTLEGIQYEANPEDLQLLNEIKQVSGLLCNQEVERDTWKLFSEMKIEGSKISLGKI